METGVRCSPGLLDYSPPFWFRHLIDATSCRTNELITSVALLDNIAWVLLTLGENETDLLLGLPENELTIVEKSLQTSGSAHIA